MPLTTKERSAAERPPFPCDTHAHQENEMTEKLEYSAADMASAAAGGWRDGQRAAAEAAQSAPDWQRIESVLDDVCSNGSEVFPGVPIYSISLIEIAEVFRRMTAQSAPATGIYSGDPLACSGCAKGCFRCMSKPQSAPAAQGQPEVQRLREALEHARLFIRNGIDLGYIRMPDADTPDPAHETLPMIDAAISASTVQEVEK